MTRSLYGRLFSYRERQARSPREDFLSEALADLLGRMPPDRLADALTSLFLRSDRARAAWFSVDPRMEVRWRTQHELQYRGKPYRADIVLEAAEGIPLLVIENKIASGLALHDDEDTAAARNQLQTYGRWLATSGHDKSWPGAIALLTHACQPPENFPGDVAAYGVPFQAVVYWHEVYHWLTRQCASDEVRQSHHSSAWHVLASELADFLAESDMTDQELTPEDFASAADYAPRISRAQHTFQQIFARIAPALKRIQPTFKHSGYRLDPHAWMWAWIFLSSPPAPAPKAWYIAWGIRFPERSHVWNQLEPPLPQVPHAFVLLGGEDARPYPSERIVPPPTWVREDFAHGFVTARTLDRFPLTGGSITPALASWIAKEIDELRPALERA